MKKCPRPPRILMTADAVGGVWRHALELAKALRGFDCHIHLVVFGRPLSPAQQRELTQLEGVEATVSELRLEWMEDPWSDVELTRDLLRAISGKFQPDVIHLNGYALAAEEWDAPVLVGAHSCVSSWWSAVKRESLPARFDHYRDRVSAGLAAANLVVAPSAAMLNDLRQHYSVAFSGTVIPNGIDSRGFVGGPKKPQIVSVGRLWDEAKNIRLLNQIARAVEWPILVAGDVCVPNGEEFRELSTLQCLGLLGASALKEELAQASIYAAPALYEPFGLAILEAALSGCALVLADIPSLREIWHDTAVFVNPAAPEMWRHELNGLIRDADRRSRLAARSQARARRFTARAMAEKYHAHYLSLAGAQSLHQIAA